MTPRQTSALDYIRERIARLGSSPSLTDIGTHLGVAKSGAWETVSQLIEMGHLVRRARRAHGLELAGEPDLRVVSSAAMRAELARRGETVVAFPQQERVATSHGISCALDGCRIAVRPGQWFCRDHWAAIDPDVQQALFRAHATARRTRSRADEALYQEAYFAACEQAERLCRRVG